MPELNIAQKSAVEYLDGPLLVLAGPGTGKTQLLSAKVEYILKNTDTDPENILCLTFTEAGAQNMRDRLRSIIGPAAGSVNIHTYHAFGSDVLAQYKNYATEFTRNLDSPIEPVAQYKIISSIQDSLPTMDILKTAKTSDIIDTISSAKSARLSASDLLKIAEYNIKNTALLNQKLSPILKDLVPRMKFPVALEKVYTPLLETFLEFSSNDPIISKIEPEANSYARELKNVIDGELEKEKPSVSPLTKWKNATFELDSEGNYRLKNVISNKKLTSLANIMQLYDEHLRAEGLFDFADMIEEAIRILKEDDGFRATLSERYQYVMLDEFQDTNPSQYEIIRLLTDYESPSVMAVGDDDQAIFAFQGANASNLLDFQRDYDSKVVVLTENYRSTQEILDSSYHIAEQIADSFAKHHSITKKLDAKKHGDKVNLPSLGGALRSLLASHSGRDPVKTGVANRGDTEEGQVDFVSGITRHEFLSSDEEYYWVAARIHDLIAAGETQSKIAIITPKHKYIAPLLPYLKSYDDINIAYEKRENVLDDPAIHQLAVLSRYIYDSSKLQPAAHRLLEILSFPYWGTNPAVALSALQGNPSLEDLEKSDDPALSRAAKILSALVALSFETPLELLFSYMLGLEEIPGIGAGESSPDATSQDTEEYSKFKLYELLSVLKSHIISYTKSESPKLKDFITFLDDYEAAGEAILNTSPYQDSTNAVQIMTAHKSKGLEFKHVFLVATDNMSWGRAKGNNNELTLPKNLTQIRHTGITDDERLRLFFVAITRAEQTLTMTNSIKDFSGKTPDRLDYLQEYEDSETKYLVSPLLPNPVIYTHYDELPEDQREQALERQWLSAYTELTPELRPLLEKRVENFRLSATHLTDFIDVIYAGPMEFYKRYILRAPAEPANGQILLGTLVHGAFEAITSQNLDFTQALELYKEKVAEAPVPDSDKTYLLEKGTAVLTASIDEFDGILHHSGAHAEVNLSSEHLFLDDIPLTGKIDHINIDEEAKTIEVYDFKTGPYHAEGWNSHPTLYKYRLQLEFYKLLLNLSPTYRKYAITKGHILFVTPDPADGRVYDKSYDFTEKSAIELRDLVQKVYYHIKALDFLDPNSPLHLYSDKKNSLKNIKELISLLSMPQ